jgi:hypothetical protein
MSQFTFDSGFSEMRTKIAIGSDIGEITLKKGVFMNDVMISV